MIQGVILVLAGAGLWNARAFMKLALSSAERPIAILTAGFVLGERLTAPSGSGSR